MKSRRSQAGIVLQTDFSAIHQGTTNGSWHKTWQQTTSQLYVKTWKTLGFEQLRKLVVLVFLYLCTRMSDSTPEHCWLSDVNLQRWRKKWWRWRRNGEGKGGRGKGDGEGGRSERRRRKKWMWRRQVLDVMATLTQDKLNWSKVTPLQACHSLARPGTPWQPPSAPRYHLDRINRVLWQTRGSDEGLECTHFWPGPENPS